MVHVRAATYGDWARLLAWRSDPETMAQFKETSAPNVKAHMAWLKRALAADDVRLFVADDSELGLSVGTARLDLKMRKNETWAACSVTVAPQARGRGYAAPLIAFLVLRARAESLAGLLAEVKPGNFASLRAFASCGFMPVKADNDFVTLEYRL